MKSVPRVKKYKYKNGEPYWLVSYTRADGTRYRKKHASELAANTDRATQIALVPATTTLEEIEQARAAILTLKSCSTNPDVKGRTVKDAVDYFCANYRDPARTLPLSDYVEEFLTRKRAENLRPPTVHEIEGFMGEFIADFPNMGVREFNDKILHDYLTKTRKPNRNRKAVLNQFFNYLAGTAQTTNRAEPVLRMNPMKALPRIRRQERDISDVRILDCAETIALLKRAANFNAQRLFVWLLFTGMRPTETVKFWTPTKDGLTGWRFINLETGVITLNASLSKTRDNRKIRIQPNLRHWLEHYKGQSFMTTNWRDKYGFSKDVLPAEKREVGDICRHTFISYLAHITKSWADLEQQAGNTKEIQIRHYLDLVHDKPSDFWAITPDRISVFDVAEEEYAARGYQNRKAAILVNRTKVKHKKNGQPL